MSGTLAFEASDGPIVVAIEVPEAWDLGSALYPDLQVAPHAGPPDMTLRARGREFELLTAPGTWSSEAVSDVLIQLELELTNALIQRSGQLALHAAGVLVGGAALLMTGESGAGKSSLTAALATRGLSVLGDDIVLLAADGTVHALKRLLKIEEPARTLLGLPPGCPPQAAMWPDAAFYRPTDLGSAWADPADVLAVVLLRREVGTLPRLEERNPAELLPDLLRGIIMTEHVTTVDADVAVEAVHGARAFELYYEETGAAASLLLESLG